MFRTNIRARVSLERATTRCCLIVNVCLSIELSIKATCILVRTIACLNTFLYNVIIRIDLYTNSTVVGPSMRFTSLFACINSMNTKSMQVNARTRQNCTIASDAWIDQRFVLRIIISITMDDYGFRAQVIRQDNIRYCNNVKCANLFKGKGDVGRIFANILMPFNDRFRAIIRRNRISARIMTFLLFPEGIIICRDKGDEANSKHITGTVDRIVAYRCDLVRMFAGIFIARLTVTNACLRRISGISIRKRRELLIRAPSREGEERNTPASVLKRTKATITTRNYQRRVALIMIMISAPSMK